MIWRKRRRQRLSRFAEKAVRAEDAPEPVPEAAGADAAAGAPERDAAPAEDPDARDGPSAAGDGAVPQDWRDLTYAIQQPDKAARRRRRANRIWRTVRLTAWLVAALVPLGLLAYDVRVTGRCDVPLLMEYARTRSVWHTTWAISLAVTGAMLLLCVPRAADPWPGRFAFLAWGLWKGAVLLRDRVSLPACAEGWAEDTLRHSLELPLNVGAGLLYAVFVVSLGVAARLHRKAQLPAALRHLGG